MKQNHKITFYPAGLSANFADGTILLDAVNSMGIPIPSPCGGKGICKKCLIEISPAASVKEEAIRVDLPNEKHLACRSVIAGDAAIYVPDTTKAFERFILPETQKTASLSVSFAIDIGTTTIEISMLDLESKQQLADVSFMNPERRYGYDIISIIAAAREQAIREKMTESLRAAIARSIAILLQETGISSAAVKQIVISGNTTMSSLFAGLDISSIGSYPYTAPKKDFEPFSANELGFDLPPEVQILLLPVISAYIGGDISGALALADSLYAGMNVFFADIGTNGEMFLKTRAGQTFVISCAMGPALEGMNISMGMTASSGAVTRVNVENNMLRLLVLGDGEPKGFAGTGIIDIIAIMLLHNIINKNGAFNKNITSPFSNAALTEAGFTISDKLTITQKDIRAIQLAKAACRCGAAILLQEAGFNAKDIELAVITGSLGSSLNEANFAALGFLPDFANAKHLLFANTSLMAAKRCCVDTSFYGKIAELRHNVSLVETAQYPQFNDLFMEYINF